MFKNNAIEITKFIKLIINKLGTIIRVKIFYIFIKYVFNLIIPSRSPLDLQKRTHPYLEKSSRIVRKHWLPYKEGCFTETIYK